MRLATFVGQQQRNQAVGRTRLPDQDRLRDDLLSGAPRLGSVVTFSSVTVSAGRYLLDQRVRLMWCGPCVVGAAGRDVHRGATRRVWRRGAAVA